ncbi:MAG: PIG-L family deacetylase, partial [Bacteroidetes bacterium]|nr:PIG-L family deacetylase [Bacteroidota bacterium]
MSTKLDILAFAAHPDDVEISASGIMIKHKAMGFKTGIVDLTAGELGTRGSAELRAKEAASASQIMGLDVRENLGLKDGFFEINEDSLIKLIIAIRRYQPEI